MGQNWHHHRGVPVWLVCNENGWVRMCHIMQQEIPLEIPPSCTLCTTTHGFCPSCVHSANISDKSAWCTHSNKPLQHQATETSGWAPITVSNQHCPPSETDTTTPKNPCTPTAKQTIPTVITLSIPSNHWHPMSGHTLRTLCALMLQNVPGLKEQPIL